MNVKFGRHQARVPYQQEHDNVANEWSTSDLDISDHRDDRQYSRSDKDRATGVVHVRASERCIMESVAPSMHSRLLLCSRTNPSVEEIPIAGAPWIVAVNDAKISGAPLPMANSVTPWIDTDNHACHEMDDAQCSR